MSAKVLGRIVSSPERPRGPDAEMRVLVPEDWIASGATLEVELPRNLACATCRGGGCDACDRSGAVTLRARSDSPELVEITLPAQPPVGDEPFANLRAVVVRIPDRGGTAPSGAELPRGNLLLTVVAGEAPAKGVKRLARPSLHPPVILESVELAPGPEPPQARDPKMTWILWAAAVAALAALTWALLR